MRSCEIPEVTMPSMSERARAMYMSMPSPPSFSLGSSKPKASDVAGNGEADAADEKVKDAFLACVNAAKECGDTYKKCREAFEAAEQRRELLINSLVEREQKAAFKQVFASPADVAEYCADAKKAKAYAKKFAKFEKSIRKAWAKSPDLKDPYVLPDAGAVDALVDRWRGPGA